MSFNKIFTETVNFFYCKNSSTACENYKETSETEFQEKVIEFSNHLEVRKLIPSISRILNELTEVTVCKILENNNCERYDLEGYNITNTIEQVFASKIIDDTKAIATFLVDIIHNRVVKARCSLECRPF